MPKKKPKQATVEEKLDFIIELLQNLFILQASIGKMKRDDIRKVLKVQTVRVSKIMKFLPTP